MKIKIMKGKIEEALEGGKTAYADRLSELILRAICGFNVISIKIPTILFANLKRSVLKFIWNHNR